MVAVAAPRPAAVPKVLPVLMVVGSVAAVAGYVSHNLKTNSRQFDKFFASYNTPESEASRRKTFEAAPKQDPRTNFLNILGW